MFRQGVISSISNPAPYYVKTQLEPDMINVGWQLVSSNIAANTGNVGSEYMWDVLWSANNLNQIGKDWFIALGWDNASNANLICTVFEQWNGVGQGGGTVAGSNLCLGYPPGFAVGAAQGANNWCNVSPSTLPFTPNSNCGCLASATGTLSNSLPVLSFTYSHSVAIDAVITMSSNAAAINSGPAYYLGTYDTFLNPTVDVYPIMALNFGLQTTSVAGIAPGSPLTTANALSALFTREPTLNTAPTLSTNFSGTMYVGMYFNSRANFGGAAGILNNVDFYANKFIYSRALVFGVSNGMRGLAKNVYISNASGNRGDTVQITINGQTYTAIFPSNNGGSGSGGGLASGSEFFSCPVFLEV
jgi:hypothetical protein